MIGLVESICKLHDHRLYRHWGLIITLFCTFFQTGDHVSIVCYELESSNPYRHKFLETPTSLFQRRP
jgi:hypothetical protein